MNKISNEEFLDALSIVRAYVDQQQSELDMLKKTASPFVSKNLDDFIQSLGLTTRARNVLTICCRQFFRTGISLCAVPAYRIGEISAIDIKRARNSGKMTISEIENALKNHGVSLKNN
jgi:DNA-directed RNA polymerase alpha subunit